MRMGKRRLLSNVGVISMLTYIAGVSTNKCFIADVCQECGHVIASHTYTFSFDAEYQVFCSLLSQGYCV